MVGFDGVWSGRVAIGCLLLTLCDSRSRYHVPDEQRLYEHLMMGYESSVRPVINASRTIRVNFRLTLNQIIDLDERKQVLTTNVFIDQEWEDENLKWDKNRFNGIQTLRVPATYVWLPDTFIFNNADDGSTGFMQGVYVLLNASGVVLWPVPVKLKSSCKVDITYFPFDDQRCILRFGSWIYSGEWMDFDSSIADVDLSYYIDNSEWELLSIKFEKGVRKYACCPEPHPDLTYTLHIRRRTFFYIFNIIVPCIMLSVLTLLTFWLPTTCGEKISLGLSVFLAFSMFMLLVAEEVPATSESVPLIGIYLTTVMTMTSLSVVMAVFVINIYNRGSKARRAPRWLKVVVLNWICRLLRMTHDVERIAHTIRLSQDEETRYHCDAHTYHNMAARADMTPLTCRREARPAPGHTPSQTSPTITSSPSDGDIGELSRRFSKIEAGQANEAADMAVAGRCYGQVLVHRHRNGVNSGATNGGMHNSVMTDNPDGEEPVWLRRNSQSEHPVQFNVIDDLENRSACASDDEKADEELVMIPESLYSQQYGDGGRAECSERRRVQRKQDIIANLVVQSCQKEKALSSRKEMIVEWQTIATVIDRLLFWIFFLGTVVAYIVILIWVPNSKPTYPDEIIPLHVLKRAS